MLAPEVLIIVRLFDFGTFAAVAEEAGLTSSGVSRMVSRFEVRLGAKLLHRSTRKLTFTPEGQVFLGYARRVLALAEAAEADVSQKHGKVAGHLRVNCGTAFARHKLAPFYPNS